MNCVQHHVHTRPEPPVGHGNRYGSRHDVIQVVNRNSWWMKSWCDEGKHWYRHKSRIDYCRRCNKSGLGIEAVCLKPGEKISVFYAVVVKEQ